MKTIITHFKEGLYRVAKPVQMNPNYRDILGSRVDLFFAKYSTRAGDGLVDADEALAILDRMLHEKYLAHFMVPPNVALAFGKTKNNLREFAFLRQFLARYELDNRIFNTGLIPARITEQRVLERSDVLSVIREDFRAYCEESQWISKPVLFQLFNYVQGYLSWQWSFQGAKHRLPRLLVVANDHSPGPVACSQAAREYGIPRIYIQHAEVSSSFPPLNFELSILRNEASRKLYESMGALDGNVFAVTREREPFVHPRHSLSKDDPVRVGVYLTSQVNWDGVRSLLNRLNLNSKVSEVFLKPHPSTRLTDVQKECSGVSVIYDTPEELHFAVVANSSVVIELLHRGIPVLQYYGMDSVPDDYYGFSRLGIAPRLNLEDFDGAFWRFLDFDDDWLRAYAEYNPTATAVGKREEQRLFQALSDWFPPVSEILISGDAGAKAEKWGQSLTRLANTTGQPITPDDMQCKFGRSLLEFVPGSIFEYVHGKTRELHFHQPALEKILATSFEQLFVERSRVAFDFFDASGRVPVGKSSFLHRVKRRDVELSGRDISENELHDLIEFALREEHGYADRRRLEYQVFFFLVRLDRLDAIRNFLSRARHIRYDEMHINQRIGLMRWARNSVQRKVVASIDPADFYRGLSPFHQLKLRVLSASEEIFRREGWSHEAVEDAFIETAPKELAESFRELVLPIYSNIRSRMKYMDVRWLEEERKAFFDQVRRALDERRPFSLVRLSDGEGYIFFGVSMIFSHNDAANRERHWWGEELSERIRGKLIPQMRSAAANADILGVPCIYRFLRDNSDQVVTLLEGIQPRGLIEVLSGIQVLANDAQLYTEEKANLPLFTDLSRLESLFAHARRVVVVGSASEKHVTDLFGGAPDFVYILVPTHVRTARNEKYESFGRPLPYVYEDVCKRVAETVDAGDLVLVAAGVVGKIFIDEAKRAGGVALDVGSSLDEWVQAGIHSLH